MAFSRGKVGLPRREVALSRWRSSSLCREKWLSLGEKLPCLVGEMALSSVRSGYPCREKWLSLGEKLLSL